MIDINVYADTSGAATLAGVYSPAKIQQAAARAINYALRRTKTQVKREITTAYRLPSSVVGDDALVINHANRITLTGLLKGNAYPESLGHFPATAYNGLNKTSTNRLRDTKDPNTGQRSSQYKTRYGKLKRSSGRTGIFVEVVKGHAENIPSAFYLFRGNKPLIMARGQYNGSTGFSFGKPRLPINALNTKSVYWASLHPKAISQWQPYTHAYYMQEINRLLQLQIP